MVIITKEALAELHDLNAHAVGKTAWTPAVVAVLDRHAKPTLAVIAKVRGSFAIHRSLMPMQEGFKMTHLPTGAVFPPHATEWDLMELVAKIEPLMDWDFTDPMTIRSAPREVKALVFAVRDFDDVAAA